MASLVWLLIPVMAVCIAGLWSSWATRRRMNGGGDAAGVAGYDAFRSAMERSRDPRLDPAEPAETETGTTEPAPSRAAAADPGEDGRDPQSAAAHRTQLPGVEHRSPAEPFDQDAPPLSPGDSPQEGEPLRERVPTGVSTDSPPLAAD